jgi:hypothetical protein
MAHDALSHEQALEQELEWLREYAVDAGWADILVRALADIASGPKHPQERATRALYEAGLGPPSPLPFWEGGETR